MEYYLACVYYNNKELRNNKVIIHLYGGHRNGGTQDKERVYGNRNLSS